MHKQSLDRQALHDTALNFVGTPYVYQCRSEYAMDCVGLLYQVFKKHGLDLNYPADYNKREHYRIEEYLDNLLETTDKYSLMDILLIQERDTGFCHHVAFVGKYGFTIESIDTRKSCVQQLPIRLYSGRIKKIYNIATLKTVS
jgi:hypothetical protein